MYSPRKVGLAGLHFKILYEKKKYTTFLINNKTFIERKNQLQTAKAHRKCTEEHIKANKQRWIQSTTIKKIS